MQVIVHHSKEEQHEDKKNLKLSPKTGIWLKIY